MTAPASTRRRVVAAAILLGLSAAAYLAALGHPFVYDDYGQIVENPYLRNPERIGDLLRLESLGDAHVVNGRRPVVLLSYFMDKALYGDRPAGFQATNLLLHLAVVLLVYLWTRRLAEWAALPGGRELVAWSAALLFGCHPMQTEAVHVPSFRPDLLCTLFVLLFLLAGSSLREVYSRRWLFRVAASGLTFLLAILSKESGVVAPVLLLAVWLIFPGQKPERGTMTVVLLLVAMVVVAVAFLGLGGAPLQAAGSRWNGVSFRFPENLWSAPWIWITCLRLLLWPYPMILDRIPDPVVSLLDPRFLAGVLGLSLAAASCIRLRERQPLLAFGLAWLLLAFAPVSNLLPLINPLAERYLYGMTIGFSLALAVGIRSLAGHDLLGVPLHRAVLAAVVTAYVAVAIDRMRDFSDERRLWSATLAHEPDSTRARVWLGLDLKRQGDLAGAAEQFHAALAANPQQAAAAANLAILLGQQGRLEEAEALLRSALERRPDVVELYWNLAVGLELQGRTDEALDALRDALEVDPFFLPAREVLVDKLIERADFAEALALAEGTLEIDPASEPSRQILDYLRWQVRPGGT